MPPFRYQLQTILKLRQAERDQLRAQLAEAYQAQQILQQHAKQVDAELSAVKDGMRQASAPGEIQVDSLLGAHRNQLLLLAQRAALVQQSQQVAEEAERRRLAVVEADRRVRTLEKLRERRLDEHRHQENKREIKRLDEVAQRRGPAGEEAP